MINITPHSLWRIPLVRRLAAACSGWISICSLLLVGCATTSAPDSPFRADAPTSQHAGDWNDVDSAVIWGVNNAEWVIHRQWDVDAQTRLYELRNSEGVSAHLRLHRPPANAIDQLEITATVGPIGDAAAERELISVVARRLNQLHGVEVAPLN